MASSERPGARASSQAAERSGASSQPESGRAPCWGSGRRMLGTRSTVHGTRPALGALDALECGAASVLVASGYICRGGGRRRGGCWLARHPDSLSPVAGSLWPFGGCVLFAFSEVAAGVSAPSARMGYVIPIPSIQPSGAKEGLLSALRLRLLSASEIRFPGGLRTSSPCAIRRPVGRAFTKFSVRSSEQAERLEPPLSAPGAALLAAEQEPPAGGASEPDPSASWPPAGGRVAPGAARAPMEADGSLSHGGRARGASRPGGESSRSPSRTQR